MARLLLLEPVEVKHQHQQVIQNTVVVMVQANLVATAAEEEAGHLIRLMGQTHQECSVVLMEEGMVEIIQIHLKMVQMEQMLFTLVVAAVVQNMETHLNRMGD